jgi:hypothetical protein
LRACLPRVGVFERLTARRRTRGEAEAEAGSLSRHLLRLSTSPLGCPLLRPIPIARSEGPFRPSEGEIAHLFVPRKHRVGPTDSGGRFSCPSGRPVTLPSGIKASAGVRKFDHASLPVDGTAKKYLSVWLSLIAKNWSLSLPATYHCGLAQKNEFTADPCIWRRWPRFELWIFCSSSTLNVPAHSGGWRDGWISTRSTCWQVRKTAS